MLNLLYSKKEEDMNPFHSNDPIRLNVTELRANSNQPFMVPAKLNNQLKTDVGITKLNFVPMGKTLVGGTQWVVSWLAQLQRPGGDNTQPLIMPKQQQVDLAKVASVVNGKSA